MKRSKTKGWTLTCYKNHLPKTKADKTQLRIFNNSSKAALLWLSFHFLHVCIFLKSQCRKDHTLQIKYASLTTIFVKRNEETELTTRDRWQCWTSGRPSTTEPGTSDRTVHFIWFTLARGRQKRRTLISHVWECC